MENMKICWLVFILTYGEKNLAANTQESCEQ